MSKSERSGTLFFRERLTNRACKVMFIPGWSALRTFGPAQIPAGKYFVIRDNRDYSKDFRHIGLIPRTSMVSRATAKTFSLNPEHYYLPRGGGLFLPLE